MSAACIWAMIEEAGEFGHMVIHPEGRKCYCGKKGCVDAYCSALRLADMEDGILESSLFIWRKEAEEHKKVWEEYMENLALTVDNLRMIFDMDVVLGGYVGCYRYLYSGTAKEAFRIGYFRKTR